jgi:hypothetical protein
LHHVPPFFIGKGQTKHLVLSAQFDATVFALEKEWSKSEYRNMARGQRLGSGGWAVSIDLTGDDVHHQYECMLEISPDGSCVVREFKQLKN